MYFLYSAAVSWHCYQDRLFSDPIYTSLKLQCPQQQHIPASPFPDSTSHLSSTSNSMVQIQPDSSVGGGGGSGSSLNYHSAYAFRHHQEASTATVSSTDPDYGGGISSAQSSLNQLPHGINIHQRRGSLQLWQFLVALLDEPAQRYEIVITCTSLVRLQLFLNKHLKPTQWID